jgi:hypothetical protein
MSVLDVITRYGIDPDLHLQSGNVIVLGITILDYHYCYPGLESRREIKELTQKIDFYFAHLQVIIFSL